jgi:WD40 repeat protein
MKLARVFILSIFISLLAVNFACTGGPAKPAIVRDVKEEFITDVDINHWQDQSLRVSPDSKTVAYVNNVDGQQAVVVNNQQQKKYDEIDGYYLVYSSDSKHMAYPARTGDNWYMVVDGKELGPYAKISLTYLPMFSPDGSRLLYLIQKDEKYYTVIDGQEYGPYDEMNFLNMVFSPDSSRYAYAGRTSDNWVVVADGKEVGSNYQIVNSLFFSPDSKHLAFSVARDNKGIMMFDGKELGSHDEVSKPIFSPDSSRFAYIAKDGTEHSMILDGQQGKQYLDINAPTFSPDSKIFAYKAQLDDGYSVLVVNGIESEEEVFVGVPIFSPDSQHLAYMVHDSEYATVIEDGKKGPKFKDIGYTSIIFSADSSRMAYLALVSGVPEPDNDAGAQPSDNANQQQGRYAVVVDGVPSREWNSIGERSIVGQSSIIFSPDSKNYAYIALNDNWKYVVVLNGKASQPYDDIGSILTFTPDSRALLYIAHLDDGLYMFVNDDKGISREAILTLYGGKINFEGDDTFNYLVLKGNEIFNVEETLEIKQ